jgi:hypothetical protein
MFTEFDDEEFLAAQFDIRCSGIISIICFRYLTVIPGIMVIK